MKLMPKTPTTPEQQATVKQLSEQLSAINSAYFASTPMHKRSAESYYEAMSKGLED